MKNLFLTLTAFISIFSFAQDESDAQSLSLKGKVKTLKTISYSVKNKFGKVEKDSIIEDSNVFYSFNKKETLPKFYITTRTIL